MVATAAVSAGPATDLKTLLAPIQAEMEAVEAKLRATDEDEVPAAPACAGPGIRQRRQAPAPGAGHAGRAAGPQPVATPQRVRWARPGDPPHRQPGARRPDRQRPCARGLPTLNAWISPVATVLAGDYLFARAAVLITETEHVR